MKLKDIFSYISSSEIPEKLNQRALVYILALVAIFLASCASPASAQENSVTDCGYTVQSALISSVESENIAECVNGTEAIIVQAGPHKLIATVHNGAIVASIDGTNAPCTSHDDGGQTCTNTVGSIEVARSDEADSATGADYATWNTTSQEQTVIQNAIFHGQGVYLTNPLDPRDLNHDGRLTPLEFGLPVVGKDIKLVPGDPANCPATEAPDNISYSAVPEYACATENEPYCNAVGYDIGTDPRGEQTIAWLWYQSGFMHTLSVGLFLETPGMEPRPKQKPLTYQPTKEWSNVAVRLVDPKTGSVYDEKCFLSGENKWYGWYDSSTTP